MADHSCQFARRTEAANWTPKLVTTPKPLPIVRPQRGAIEHYNDKPQLIVSRIRRCEAKEYTLAGFFTAVLIECLGIYAALWRYADSMPVLPVLNVGVLPVLKLMILPVTVFWIVKRISARRSAVPG